jgi:hypothetical protein
MSRMLRYDPEKHKGLPLYQIVSVKVGEHSIGTGHELVTDEKEIENADKVPYFFKVKYSDVVARDSVSSYLHPFTDEEAKSISEKLPVDVPFSKEGLIATVTDCLPKLSPDDLNMVFKYYKESGGQMELSHKPGIVSSENPTEETIVKKSDSRKRHKAKNETN